MEQQEYLESEKLETTSRLTRCENELKTVRLQNTNAKKNSEESEEKSRSEIEKLRREIDELKIRDRDNSQQLLAGEKEIDYLQ